MDVSFIMVRPQYPSNIGAAARALAAMGFERLILVDPEADTDNPRIAKIAKHAQHVLDSMEITSDSVQELTRRFDFTVATSMRNRLNARSIVTVDEMAQRLQERADMLAHVGVFFGCESTGLTTEETNQCDLLATIPTAGPQPPLNLAQSITVVSYELSKHLQAHIAGPKWMHTKASSEREYRTLKRDLAELLERIGFGAEDVHHSELLARVDRLNRKDLFFLRRLKQKLGPIVESSNNINSIN